MSARADTDLLALQTRATSLTGKDCYRLTAEECADIIALSDQPLSVSPTVLSRLGLDAMFSQHFGGGK